MAENSNSSVSENLSSQNSSVLLLNYTQNPSVLHLNYTRNSPFFQFLNFPLEILEKTEIFDEFR